MDDAIRQFNSHFEHWGIRLPRHAVVHRKGGQISEAGWAIWYQFGSDDEGEFLDYYASHRMTDDSHVRLRANREPEWLPAIHGLHLVSEDPEENARLEAGHEAHNARVSEMLEEKGFGLTGFEPGLVAVNRFLRTRKRSRRDRE